ncbi:unnamed protein product [Sphagnum jensenii]|uniref:Electron transporter n=1 Tax=Sphagnum jensenii TaxID=128206 RepID=A0ABP1BJ49_9BRYO
MKGMMGRRTKWRKDHLAEDWSIEIPVSRGTTTAEDDATAFTSLDSEELGCGHCRSLSAPDEESGQASWDFSPQASLNQTLKESLRQWRLKIKRKGSEENKKQQLVDDRRTALEKDVAQLQTLLDGEKTLRVGLERALQEASDPPTPRLVSPEAHDLITEIVSLQKQVSHLEQHVLSLYRKVFDQRLSTRHHNRSSDFSSSLQSPPSSYHVSRFKAEQRLETQVPQQLLLCPPSSSPQHHCHDDGSIVVPTTQGFKRPHSAITSAADQSKTQQVGSFLNTSFYCIDKRQPLQAVVVKPSSKTPNELSEELVRCMAAIYCKLADPPLPELSPFSPGSSSSDSLATTHGSSHEFSNSNDSWSPLWRTDNTSCEMINGCVFPDPYSVKDVGSEDVGPYSSMVEVPWICVDKDRLTYAAARKNFGPMLKELEKVDPGQMTHEQKLAFWINVYNALMMHAYLVYGIPRNRLKRLSLLQKAAYKVGPFSINAQTIEHSILGCRSNRPAQWLQALLNPTTKFKVGDERRAYALQIPEPAVCFALCCGGYSDPVVRVYTAQNVRLELGVAKREFLQASVGIRDNKVILPKILEWYSRELVIDSAALLEWVRQKVSGKLEAQIQCIKNQKSHRSPAHCLQWMPYNFGFRYIFVHDLVRRSSPFDS